MRVDLWSEQLLQPIPGGIGTYVRSLIRWLPRHGVEVAPVVASHGANQLWSAGLSGAARVRGPRKYVYRRWETGSGPVPDGGGQLIHAPSLAIPPSGSKPLVATVHDLAFVTHPDTFPERGRIFHERMLSRLNECDRVIVPSKATADVLARVQPHPNVEVVPMGVDLEPLDGTRIAQLLGEMNVGPRFVLWLGTVEPRKNPEGVIRGFASALRQRNGDDIKLVLAGPPGWWQDDLAEFVEKNGLTDRLVRVPAPNHAQKVALFSAAQVFLYPSLAEGFGLPILEAMACGTPVVTSNRSSMPEVAGSAALLVDPTSDEAIGGAIARILDDDQTAADLRRLGFERARKFTWKRTAELTAAVYAGVLGEGPS